MKIRELLVMLGVGLFVNHCSESVDSRTQIKSTLPQPEQTLTAPHQQSETPAILPPVETWQQASRWTTDHVEPPVQYYTALLNKLKERANQAQLNLTDESGDDRAPILYVSFGGEQMAYGFDDGESFILCEDEVTIPAANFSAAERAEILLEVQRYFDDANVLLSVVDYPPEDGDYTKIVVTGAIDDLGCEEDDSILGIAPLDTGNKNPNDIGFAFIRNIDPQEDDLIYTTAVVIAHEAGHTFGLYHNDNDHAIMYPSIQTDVIGFDRGYARKFLFKTEQDSPRVLRKALGVRDLDLLAEDEEDSEPLTSSWCERIASVQGFILANFTGLKLDTSWLKPLSFCEG